MSELHDFMLNQDVDLLTFLRKQLSTIQDLPPVLLDAHVILVIGLRKTRYDASPIEAIDTRAFLLDVSVRQLGTEIGIWDSVETHVGRLLAFDTTKNGDQVPVALLNPQFSFSTELAAVYSGYSPRVDKQITVVGVGALGSQMVMNLVRMGFGQWTIVDHDNLFPHNLARHVLSRAAVGYPKATSVARMANELYTTESVAQGLAVNLLEANSEQIFAALDHSDIIIDTAASVAVSRFLVHQVASSARRVSLFLNPQGTDLVVMAEDTDRTLWLDSLEMQYYRGVLHEPALQNHLMRNEGQVRYANSCRDISAALPQDQIALHAAIASRALRLLNQHPGAALWIWHTETDMVTVSQLVIPTTKPARISIGEWLLVTDHYVLDTVRAARSRSLPNETGGVLIGSYDMSRKIVYVVDTILSPADSLEWPTVYVRGHRGLKNEFETIATVTGGQLEYVGEWHSHPDSANCQPSSLDCQAFQWLTKTMSEKGLPPLMLIVGQDNQYEFYLNRIND